MCGTILKLGLAMGGGVAMGSFSGSALTESIKLLILFGKDKDEERYEKVVIDSFSGASAGAASIAILIRCLLDYKPMMKLTSLKSKEKILDKVKKDYAIVDPEDLAHFKKHENAICAIQVAQEIQHLFWVESLHMKGLLKNNKNTFRKREGEPFGLLDREYLVSVIKKMIVEPAVPDLNNTEILDKNRFMYACSLTNLLPMPLNSIELNADMTELNFLKSTASRNHTELRVFDFAFTKEATDNTDKRWIQITNPEYVGGGAHSFSILDKSCWKTIAATALACGSFPLAFPSVSLKRYKKEYDFHNDSEKSLWPSQLREMIKHINKDANINKNTYFEDQTVLDYETFNFPYVDGGTFNNEPIKEVFRLMSFQDFYCENKNKTRLMLFVDPIVRKEKYPAFNISSAKTMGRNNEKEFAFLKEFPQLKNTVGTLLGAMINQGSIKEEEKIRGMTERFELQETLSLYLDNVNVEPNDTLLDKAYETIKNYLQEDIISLGTRDVNTYLKKRFDFMDDASKEYLFPKYKNECPADKPMCFSKKMMHIKSTENQSQVTKFMLKLLSELALDTAGKNPDVMKRSIFPLTADEKHIIDLPGSDFEAFSGFASKSSREYAFAYGKLNAYLVLKRSDESKITEDITRLEHTDDKMVNAFIGGHPKIEQNLKHTIQSVGFYKKNYKTELSKNLFFPLTDRLEFLGMGGDESNYFQKLKLYLKLICGSIILPFSKKQRRREYKKIEKNMFASIGHYIPNVIDIRIKSKNPILLFRKQTILLKHTNKSSRVVHVWRNNERNEIRFPLYLLNDNEDEMKFIYHEKIPIDKNWGDPNLSPDLWKAKMLKEFKHDFLTVHINNSTEFNLNEVLKKTNTSFYSLKYLKGHVNPSLVYDLDEGEWQFVEQTQSFETML